MSDRTHVLAIRVIQKRLVIEDGTKSYISYQRPRCPPHKLPASPLPPPASPLPPAAHPVPINAKTEDPSHIRAWKAAFAKTFNVSLQKGSPAKAEELQPVLRQILIQVMREELNQDIGQP
jgi:hypothetical protein